ncbi:YceI family protein [Aestuariibacter halophilus]|uniref:YceI family protein n=1 Tax=Fluctibacter halophilus TaxID=226011 RepID=A0ABS8G874_9ALTE|nr:YceI family protein [Aestuariibacter halophilus]MCC2616296.1 YceI family protein [Aestuariibacter halophilus]
MKKTLIATTLLGFLSLPALAADYVIDTKGAHASINFKIKHLGYSWLTGRFNTFDGTFSYDKANPGAAKVVVNIDTASIDSNHAERDKHIRSDDFLDVNQFPKAKFVSTNITDNGDGTLVVAGDLTLHGVTKSVTIDAYKIGEGEDPWGGYRAGFSGTTQLTLADFNINGPATIDLDLHIEGIKQ